MRKRILIPLDGSDLAEGILPQVDEMLKGEDVEVILEHVITPPNTNVTRAMALPQHIEDGEAYVKQIRELLEKEGYRVRTRVDVGHAAEAILDAAAEEKASLIAMSTHGRTGLARWVFGSVAEKVLRASRFPLFLHRSFTGGEPSRPRSIRKILVPIDGSPMSLGIVPYVAEVAEEFGARVLLLHVFANKESQQESINAEKNMGVAARIFDRARTEHAIHIEQGSPAEKILSIAETEPMDLIAMTTHGRSGLTRWVLGSVTEKVLRASTAPMLVVREVKPGKG